MTFIFTTFLSSLYLIFKFLCNTFILFDFLFVFPFILLFFLFFFLFSFLLSFPKLIHCIFTINTNGTVIFHMTIQKQPWLLINIFQLKRLCQMSHSGQHWTDLQHQDVSVSQLLWLFAPDLFAHVVVPKTQT